MTAPDAPRIGSVLGDRYELLRHLGEAELSDIYEAEDQVLHRRVAVRVSRATEPADQARFDAEARNLARVNEPGIARVYDAGQHGDTAFVVLQLVADTADETTGPIAVTDPSGDPTGEITRVIGGADHTQLLPVMVPLAVAAPVARRSRNVPVWGMVAGLAAVLVAILVFAASHGGGGEDPVPTVASTSTTVTTVRTRVPVTTPTTAPTTTTTGPTTTTSLEPTTTTTMTLPPLPGDGVPPGQG